MYNTKLKTNLIQHIVMTTIIINKIIIKKIILRHHTLLSILLELKKDNT